VPAPISLAQEGHSGSHLRCLASISPAAQAVNNRLAHSSVQPDERLGLYQTVKVLANDNAAISKKNT
jgi:hypothetical protein